jgi:hypothetical protein
MKRQIGFHGAPKAEPSPSRLALREARRKTQLLREEAEAKSLERRLLRESAYWVGPYQELLTQLQARYEPEARGAASANDRRYGANYPLYRTEQELSIIRAPSRLVTATNSYAIGLLEGLTSYTVGVGFTFQAQAVAAEDEQLADAVQQVIDAHLDHNSWSGGEMPSLEEELFQRSLVDGEAILVQTANADGTADVRPIEPEQLKQPPGTDEREWSFGVYTEPRDLHKKLAYSVCYDVGDWEEYDAEQVVHIPRNVMRGMKRGIPDFSFDAYESLHAASMLRSALGETAAERASIVGVRQHETATQDQVQSFVDEQADYREYERYWAALTANITRYRKGGWQDIDAGQKFVDGPSSVDQPAHLQVLGGLTRAAAVRWNAPEWLGSADASNNNYASSLTAESPFVRYVLRQQARYRAAFLCSIWFAIKAYCNAHGGIPVGGQTVTFAEVKRRIKVQCEAPSPETRDKMQEAQRLLIESQAGVTSIQTWQQIVGRDPDVEQRNRDEFRDANPDLAGGGAMPGMGGDDPFGDDPFGDQGGENPFGPEPDDDPDGDPFGGGLGESLLEAGFTGTITDKRGAKRHYVNGKQVKGQGGAAKKPVSPTAQAKANGKAVLSAVMSGKADKASMKALGEHAQSLTVPELKSVAAHLGQKLGGAKRKAEIVERLRAHVAEKVAAKRPAAKKAPAAAAFDASPHVEAYKSLMGKVSGDGPSDGEIEKAVSPIAALTKDKVLSVAKAVGINRRFATKGAAVEAIKQSVADRRDTLSRVELGTGRSASGDAAKGEALGKAMASAELFSTQRAVSFPTLKGHLTRELGREPSPKEMQDMLLRAEKAGAVELHVVNEVQNLTKENHALGIERNGKMLYYAILKDESKLAAAFGGGK